MANITDMSRAIHSALEEIGVTGELAVRMDGDHATGAIGQRGGDDLAVTVDFHDLPASNFTQGNYDER